MDFRLSDKEKKILLACARSAIESRLNATSFPQNFESTPTLTMNCGAFVTLHKKTTKRLRGCIGYITASRPLFETVK